MTKKLIGILVLLVAALAFGLHHYLSQPKNIFDEIYQETKKTYQNNNVLGKIKDFDIRGSWPTDNPDNKYMPFGKYEDLPEGYSEIKVNFNFQNDAQITSITFEKSIASKVRVRIWSKYSHSKGILTKTVKIALENGDSDKYIEDQSKVKTYLAKYGITASDLDKYYNEVVNQKVLKDWCSIYDSKFSPKDYGDVTVKTEWENW
ncbi:hypothetical protein SAMN05216460_0002 [Streptococcus sp. 45]|uniref:TipC family immunity protein n=1 Tax=Streptococcus sp. 45 TaxID=1855326 RepID=UPI0008B80519|nr:TipC family immunity protein [Streptococcus sp. 45]SEI37099.1 hypothetical protein SAMN05216460_0002 [Streptococcus sp. 45]